jgi:hypothetical protein
MNSSRLLESSYLSIGPDLNLSGQETYLSVGATVQNPPLSDGVAAHSGERSGGDGDLARRRLLSSMTLRRSSRS